MIDTNEIFYIGKGTNYRFIERHSGKRSKAFLDIYNNNNCATLKVIDNLTEKEALDKEEEFIAQYRKCHPNGALLNVTTGGVFDSGRPVSEENRKKMSERIKGKNNPGCLKEWTKEQREAHGREIAESGRYKGGKNPYAVPIACLETGEKFDYIGAAVKKYNQKATENFYGAINNPFQTVAGLHWVKITEENECLIDDDEKRFELLLKNISSRNSRNRCFYIDVSTKEIMLKGALLKKLGLNQDNGEKFLKSTDKYILVSEYYSRTYQ